MRALMLFIALSLGCTDFALPSELSRTQILAVRATPAAIEPGGRAHLEALVAGPDGVAAGLAASWTTDGDGASIETDDGGEAWLVAARAGAVAVELRIDAGEELVARKTVPVVQEAGNPEMVRLEAGGEPVAETLVARVGGATALEAELDAEPAVMSWFATIGTIDRYRHNPTELVSDEAGEGWLIAVGRDDAGGVTWRVVRLVVE
jgi:hypothetical protein